jgi:hypothetical protein
MSLVSSSYVFGIGFVAKRFLDRSQLQTVGEPYDSASHADNETRRSCDRMRSLAATGSPKAAELLEKADDLDEALAKDPSDVLEVG